VERSPLSPGAGSARLPDRASGQRQGTLG
jgi:hypothetical protein